MQKKNKKSLKTKNALESKMIRNPARGRKSSI